MLVDFANLNGPVVRNPASNRADRLFPSRWADSRESHSEAGQISVYESSRSSHWKRILREATPRRIIKTFCSFDRGNNRISNDNF